MEAFKSMYVVNSYWMIKIDLVIIKGHLEYIYIYTRRPDSHFERERWPRIVV